MHDSMHAIAKFVELMNSYEDTRLADWMDAHGAVENARKRVEQTKYTLKRHQHELFRETVALAKITPDTDVIKVDCPKKPGMVRFPDSFPKNMFVVCNGEKIQVHCAIFLQTTSKGVGCKTWYLQAATAKRLKTRKDKYEGDGPYRFYGHKMKSQWQPIDDELVSFLTAHTLKNGFRLPDTVMIDALELLSSW